MHRSTVAAAAAILMLGACATPSTDDSQPQEEKEYRTGSNIPVRDRSTPSQVRTVDPAAIERARSLGVPGGSRGPAN